LFFAPALAGRASPINANITGNAARETNRPERIDLLHEMAPRWNEAYLPRTGPYATPSAARYTVATLNASAAIASAS
jgi:hypothetical protein